MSRQQTRERVGEHVIILKRRDWWYAQYMVGVKQRRRSLQTKSVRDARRQALEIDDDLRKGRLRVTEDIEIGPLFDRYLSHIKTEGRRPNTIKRYRPVFARFEEFCRQRGVRKASQVDIVLLEDYREALADEDASEDALYRASAYVKMVLRYAEERNLIPANRLKSMKIRKPRVEAQPCFSAQQVESILAKARGQGRDIFTVLAFTGLRRGELQWLTWKDVDLDSDPGWIHVRAKDGWMPKSRKDRKLPVYPRVREVLTRLSRKHRWVFTARASSKYPKGGNQIHLDHLREKLLAILSKLGIEHGGLHSFRRFFISWCANRHVPPNLLMHWVGHADLRMVVRYYSLQDEASREAMAALVAEENGRPYRTKLGQKGVPESKPRPQHPAFTVVASAS